MSRKSVWAVAFTLLFIFTLLLTGCSKTPAKSSASKSPSASAEVSESPTDEETASPDESETASPDESETASPDESASASSSKSTDPNVKKYDGYLVDVTCGNRGKDEDGNDLKKSPKLHTVACLKENADSGYGMFVYTGGAWKFYKFDSAGNKQIKRYIVDKTKKKDNVKIAVRGVMEDNIIKVKTVLNYGLE